MHNTKIILFLCFNYLKYAFHCFDSFKWKVKRIVRNALSQLFCLYQCRAVNLGTEIYIVNHKHCSPNSLKSLSICGWGKYNHFPGHIFERRSQQMCWKPKKYVWHCYAMTQHILFLFLQIYAVSIVVVKKAFR